MVPIPRGLAVAAGLVEPFNDDHYNKNLSVAENLLFAVPAGPRAERQAAVTATSSEETR